MSHRCIGCKHSEKGKHKLDTVSSVSMVYRIKGVQPKNDLAFHLRINFILNRQVSL